MIIGFASTHDPSSIRKFFPELHATIAEAFLAARRVLVEYMSRRADARRLAFPAPGPRGAPMCALP